MNTNVRRLIRLAQRTYRFWVNGIALAALLGFLYLFLWSISSSSLASQRRNSAYIAYSVDQNSKSKDGQGSKTLNIENLGSGSVNKKKLGPMFDPNVQYSWNTCSVSTKHNYIPCLDIENTTSELGIRRHQERNCPDSPIMCLVSPPTKGYGSLVQWPESKWKVLYSNVEHQELDSFIKNVTWVEKSGEYLTFPQNQSQFKGGVFHYVDSIDEMVLDFEWGEKIRVILDIGCTDSSFGAALLDKDVLTLSLGLNDDSVDLAQVALERGFPAIVSPLRTRRLPFPGGVFDAIHCGKCSMPWFSNGGSLLLEMNRILRPGGYFILSLGHDCINQVEAVSTLAASICWETVAHDSVGIHKLDVTIYEKLQSKDKCKSRGKKDPRPPPCEEDERPDAVWYTQMKTCLHAVPAATGQRGFEWPKEWPMRLETFPDWFGNKEILVADTMHWKTLVEKSYLTEMGINWLYVRNVMDLSATYGGFAAALVPQKAWVMNVVPVHASDTLPIIYERGLAGIYHDWCEAFGTYPRSYDLLHVDHLFSLVENRCEQPVAIVVEMDRILRPGGWAIIREKAEILDHLEIVLRSLHWNIRVRHTEENEEGVICAHKTTWRP